jgi:pyruvate dehydrogenase E2 component (dihydrolipoamide acetyltransferase)
MARYEFKLPDIGEGVSEGEIVGWHVRAGDVVTEDQPIVELMTDKATVTITAPKAGVVVETRGKVGETMPVHAVLVVFELPSISGTAAVAPTASLRTNGTSAHPPPIGGAAALAVGELRETLPGMKSAAFAAPPAVASAYFNSKPLATPHTRKFARDINVDLRRVRPTGPQGRVMKADVESFAGSPKGAAGLLDPSAHGRIESAAAEALATPASELDPASALATMEERIPLAGLRRRIAQKMSRSTKTAAHFTFVEECDVTELKLLRARLKDAAQAKGANLSFLPFIVKAVVAALKNHPMLNTALDETTNEIVFRKYYNIGIAAATDAGLLVPVLRHADKLSILEIAREVERLAVEARSGKAKHEDLTGSTFTITSLGAKSGLLATPIINFPEVAILGVHQMKTKPVVKAGQIVIGDVMLLSLSFDHRVVDGHVGAAFAYEVISYLEQPHRLLLDMA